MQGNGSKAVMLIFRNNIKKAEARNNDTELWFTFTDYAKAFDKVQPCALLRCGDPKHLVWIVRKAHHLIERHTTYMARVGNEASDEFPFEDVVGQCCVLVHMLFQLDRRENHTSSRRDA